MVHVVARSDNNLLEGLRNIGTVVLYRAERSCITRISCCSFPLTHPYPPRPKSDGTQDRYPTHSAASDGTEFELPPPPTPPEVSDGGADSVADAVPEVVPEEEVEVEDLVTEELRGVSEESDDAVEEDEPEERLVLADVAEV